MPRKRIREGKEWKKTRKKQGGSRMVWLWSPVTERDHLVSLPHGQTREEAQTEFEIQEFRKAGLIMEKKKTKKKSSGSTTSSPGTTRQTTSGTESTPPVSQEHLIELWRSQQKAAARLWSSLLLPLVKRGVKAQTYNPLKGGAFKDETDKTKTERDTGGGTKKGVTQSTRDSGSVCETSGFCGAGTVGDLGTRLHHGFHEGGGYDPSSEV